MATIENSVKEKISLFKNSISADLYSPNDIVDFHAAENSVNQFLPEITEIQSLVHENLLDIDNLSRALLEFPKLYQIICSLLSITSSIELEDGRILPAPSYHPRDASTAETTAAILLELGISRLIKQGADLRTLLLLVQIGADAPRRRARVDGKITSKIKSIIGEAIDETNKNSELQLSLVTNSSLPSSTRRVVDYVIAVDGISRIALATTFQTYSGGRQSRDMSTVYPAIKSTLATSGISFLLIADGQGMKGISERVLAELFQAVPFTMSLNQAQHGGLQKAIVDILHAPEEISVDAAGLNKIINSSLEFSSAVFADALPIGPSPARLALANYASVNKHLDLILKPEIGSLVWKKDNLVESFRKLRAFFNAEIAIDNLVELIYGSTLNTHPITSDNLLSKVISLENDPVFTEKFLVSAYSGSISSSVLREVAKTALQNAQSSRVSILVTYLPLSQDVLKVIKDTQAFLPVTIVVIDVSTCLIMAQERGSPRERLGTLLLEQTDLTKLSPFVVRSVTPSRVFFGREEEEAALLSTLSTNSVALLGGRRIGKTSLMRHCFSRLIAADLRPVFADCQVVRTWNDFGKMAARNWSVPVPEDFRPNHLFDVVKHLNDNSGRSIVIVLDEIDQLLDWDKNHTEDEVPEAFFRACRAISQQGLAQFVFSGERTISNTLWDASSPHWNFCRPIMLRQLTRAASDSLISEPLESLGIKINERQSFLLANWQTTDGHPELIQFIGDKIVSLVNKRDRKDVFTSPEDINSITNQFEYAEQYLETYWGQATSLERIVSILLIDGDQPIDTIIRSANAFGLNVNGGNIHSALRMLELYGIAKQSALGYKLQALWFSSALSFYGGVQSTINRFIGGVQV